MNRDDRQEYWALEWLKRGRGILELCPRSGKCRTSLKIALKGGYKRILIVAPLTDIKTSWDNEVEILGLDLEFDFITTKSLHKLSGEYDLIILDEIHDYSIKQLEYLKKYKNCTLLGLTGTMTNKSRDRIYKILGLETVVKYTISEGIRDGILADYTIIHHIVPLSNKTYITKSGKIKTESSYYNSLNYLYNTSGKSFFMEQKLRSFLIGFPSKIDHTKELLQKYCRKRVLVFGGNKESVDKLGIPVYYTGKKDKKVFEAFTSGVGNHLACIKMMTTGITIKPISIGILNAITGNPEDITQTICRFLGYEYDTPTKRAEIHIITSDKKYELERLETALMFLDKKKISKNEL